MAKKQKRNDHEKSPNDDTAVAISADMAVEAGVDAGDVPVDMVPAADLLAQEDDLPLQIHPAAAPEAPAAAAADGEAEDPFANLTPIITIGADKALRSPVDIAATGIDAIPEYLRPQKPPKYRKDGRLKSSYYEKEISRLQAEMVKLQYWVKEQGMRVVIVFEGRSGAGKGGVIKRITERTNPRIIRVVALPAPSDREKTQWWFQKYVAHLPAAGEIVLFDRSWYNRALVEPVMGFCTEEQYREFLRSCPQFERMLVRSGIILLKYWFSVSDEEQERRFQARNVTPMKRWKLSPMDLEDRRRWVEYSKAKDTMFAYTDIKQAPWYVVNADDKKKMRLNCMTHILSQIPYEDITPEPIKLPPREGDKGYIRPPFQEQTFVPAIY
ncbi:MAG: polyphosphate kinase 2 [Anaerolineales bacterium]|nr:polyphosphate kinase 2 [Anaerolineales bacterium]